MSKNSGNKVSVEAWTVKDRQNKYNTGGVRQVAKVAVRNSKGQFLGATNYRGSVIG